LVFRVLHARAQKAVLAVCDVVAILAIHASDQIRTK